jgi:hypothetical protein
LSKSRKPGLKAQRGWPDWREALARVHADPADAKARERLGYAASAPSRREVIPSDSG